MKNRNVLSIAMLMGMSAMGKSGVHFCLDSESIAGPNACSPASPGISTTLFYAKFADISVHSRRVAASTSFATHRGLYDTGPTMVATKTFKTIQLTLNENSYKAGSNGEKQSGSFKVSLRGFITGIRTEVIGFANESKYVEYIFVATLPDGRRVQIGDAGKPASVSVNIDTLKDEDTGAVGLEIMVESYHTRIVELTAGVTLPV